MTIATVNDLWPGVTPAGTEVEVLAESGPSVFVRVGKHIVKASPKWLDFPEPPKPELVPRRLRTLPGVLS